VFSYLRALLLLLLLFYIAIIYESISLALLGFAGTVLLVCSFFYLLAVKKGVSAQLAVPIGIAESGRPFFVKAEASNKFTLPQTKVLVVIRYKERGDRRTKKEKILLGRNCQVTIGAPGNYLFSLSRLRLYDLTGLFYLTKKCTAASSVLVLPKPEAIPVVLGENVRSFFGDADTFDDLKPGYDPSETFDVREFRAGDRLQNVHWKLSAKSEALVVKENSLPKACPLVCFFEPSRAHYETFLSTISGISYSLMDAGCPHFAVWYSDGQKEIMRTRVDDEESYYLFLTTFLQDAAFLASQNLPEEYRRKYRGEPFLHEIFVGKDGAVTLDGNAVEEQNGVPRELVIK
jgi:uncharacterized protein (DUF58 family)